MTVVVTGACGHIGANLVRALIDNGRSVRSLVHVHDRGITGLDTEIIKCDICRPESLCNAFRGADVVYHLAGCISLSMRDWPELESINVIGTRNITEACLQAGVRRLIHFSSIHALQQEPFSVPVDESRPLSDSPDFPPYDRSKALGEKEVQKGIEKGLDAVILNPTAVIGPHDYEPSYLGRAILDMARHKLPALVTGGYDWVDVRDVVQGAIAAEEMGVSGSRYLLSGHWISLCDIAKAVSEITCTPPPRLTFPLWLARLGVPIVAVAGKLQGKSPLYTKFSLKALESNHNMSHEKATRELGYQPRPFRDTLEDTLLWFKESGRLPDSIMLESRITT